MNVLLHGSEAGAGCYPAELYRFGADGEPYAAGPVLETKLAYPHTNRFHNFVEALLGREDLCVTPEQALAVQRTLDAVYESSRTGREVAIAGVARGKA